ncbi:MAG TPA: hypothetical protein VK975_02625, partial [Acidimicrobiales bacterium]|nr:hypothetical protein [Acidimicrobiales bacterium]
MIERLEAVLDEMCGADPASFSDAESIVALHRCLARLEAVVTRAVGAFDAGGDWSADVAASASSWLSSRCGITKATASRRVQRGRDLRHLPVAEA